MLDAELIVPRFYFIDRKADEAALEEMERKLSIHPCGIALISRHEDASVAHRFVDITITDTQASEATVERWAEETGRPVLVIGDPSCWSKLISTN